MSWAFTVSKRSNSHGELNQIEGFAQQLIITLVKIGRSGSFMRVFATAKVNRIMLLGIYEMIDKKQFFYCLLLMISQFWHQQNNIILLKKNCISITMFQPFTFSKGSLSLANLFSKSFGFVDHINEIVIFVQGKKVQGFNLSEM